MNAYGEFVAAIADIPATRLLGRAPEGMNSSGDSQQQDWSKRIKAMQTLELGPCLDRADIYLVQSALGKAEPSASYAFAPLDIETDKERAERFAKQMEAADKLAGLNAMPEQAFNRGIQSLMIAEGYLPELEAALSEIPDDERYGIVADPSVDDPTEGGGPDSTGAGGSGSETEPPVRVAANDATPRPLYVYRKLLNAGELVDWAQGLGVKTNPADQLHVTVLYSKQPVDPMAMGEGWSSDPDGGLVIKAGGPRALERFGEGALVLQFASWSLQSRHNEMVQAGASHDWPDYLPHVTISYEAPADLDLEAIKPYAGELRFGPEIFEPLDPDWKSKIAEA
ncbi:anti-CBASS protein Acb1 family protein [Novosphingobium sp. ES2-1]|uniref:anti-CBASS protein Acb1 family protein n=1 Tax=Novosphingobium sp. ES2-1 TaxID=2780074 RepID=UPI001E3914F6|nr:anti-CBASS Acb1 family protein [Novosphingobium sp. ES2-1]